MEIDSTTVEAAITEEPSTETPVVETPSGEESPAAEPQTVPKERLDEAIAESKELKSRLDLLEQNSALAAANTAPEKVERVDIFEEAGLSDNDEDMVSVGQVKQIITNLQNTGQAQFNDQSFHIHNPDFRELVGTPEQLSKGELAAPLQSAMDANPALKEQIAASKNPKAAALAIARGIKVEPKKAETDAEGVITEAVKNSTRPKSALSVRGGSGIAEDGAYANMSDEEFIALVRSRGGQV